MKYLLIACICATAICAAAKTAKAQEHPARILYDTDLGPDSDDAGALALLHALVSRGEAMVLGVACSTTSPWCAPAADVVNTYYHRPDIPVGTLKGDGPAGGSEEWYGDSFNGYLAGHFPNSLQHGSNAADALVLYRQVLATQPDTSVKIVATGPLTNLRNLLTSPPDSISPLSGAELVRRKVKALSVMGGKYPEGSESNFMVDASATKQVVGEWPTPITFSGFEIGVDLLTGPRLATETPPDNPVTTAYHFWDIYFARRFQPDFDPSTGIWPHSSYDQTAILYAVRGLQDYWTAQTMGRNEIRDDGSNAWQATPDSEHAYLIEHMPREQLARIIEDLMVAPPGP